MQSRSFCVNLNFDLNLDCFNDVSFGMILLSVELIGVMITRRHVVTVHKSTRSFNSFPHLKYGIFLRIIRTFSPVFGFLFHSRLWRMNGIRNTMHATKKSTPPIKASISPLLILVAMKKTADRTNNSHPHSWSFLSLSPSCPDTVFLPFSPTIF
jgi:hypothetical protein